MVLRDQSRAVAGFVLAATAMAVAALWTGPAAAACLSPVDYRISDIDPRFGLSRAEVSAAIADAEALWEDAVGRDLFRRHPTAALTISLIYDDRQETRDFLAEKDARQDEIQLRYAQLKAQLEAERQRYEQARQALEQRMRVHNEEVSYWNQQGGAPSAEYRRIQTTAGHLRGERDKLVQLSREINALVTQANDLANRHNLAAVRYNEGVEALNERYNHAISIGEFARDRIRIFSFEDGFHLRLVLAHELGHALALGHVDDPAAIMYFKLEPQVAALEVSEADLAEFARVCGR